MRSRRATCRVSTELELCMLELHARLRLQTPGGAHNPTLPTSPFAVFISPNQGGFTANYSIAIVSQHEICECQWNKGQLFKEGKGWGSYSFIKAERLHDQSNGFLRGDRLVLRATVEVTERGVQPMAQ